MNDDDSVDDLRARNAFHATLGARTTDELLAMVSHAKAADGDAGAAAAGGGGGLEALAMEQAAALERLRSDCEQLRAERDAAAQRADTLEAKLAMKRTARELLMMAAAPSAASAAAATGAGRAHAGRRDDHNASASLNASLQQNAAPTIEAVAAHITPAEAAALRAELELQDKMVRALERDNEQLGAEKRALAARVRELERERSAGGARASLLSDNQQQRRAAHGDAAATTATAAPAAASPVELKRAAAVEAELRAEVEALRQAKRDLERQLQNCGVVAADGGGGGDPAEMAALDARQARAELQRATVAHKNDIADMARKIAWYVEHQEFNRAQEQLIAEQQTTIQALRLKLHECESLVTKSGVVRTDKDRQLRHLQRRVLELEEALKTKNPNSIAELIRSCQPALEQHRAVVRGLEEQVAQLQGQLAERDAECARAVDRLRVESDRVRLAYQARLEKLEDEMRQRVLHAQTRRVAELEKKLADQRAYYIDKLRQQEQIMSALRRGLPAPAQAAAQPAAAPNAEDAAKPVRRVTAATARRRAAAGKTDEGADDDKENDAAASSHPPPAAKDQGASSSPPPASAATADGSGVSAAAILARENAVLRAQLEAAALSAAAAAAAGVGGAGVSFAPFGGGGGGGAASLAPSAQLLGTLQSQLAAAHQELALHRRLLAEAHDAQRVAAAQAEDRQQALRGEMQRALSAQRAEHDASVLRLQQAHHEEIQRLVEQHHAAMRQSEEMLMTSPATNTGGVKSHAMSLSGRGVQEYLNLVAKRLQVLETRQAQGEAEARHELAEVRRVAQFEVAVARQEAELRVRQKEQELEGFRLNLDALLAELAQLRTP